MELQTCVVSLYVYTSGIITRIRLGVSIFFIQMNDPNESYIDLSVINPCTLFRKHAYIFECIRTPTLCFSAEVTQPQNLRI